MGSLILDKTLFLELEELFFLEPFDELLLPLIDIALFENLFEEELK